MTYLLVAYDLVGPDDDPDDYERLIDRLEQYPDCAKVQRSTWLLKLDASAEEVAKDLVKLMGPTARLFVAGLTPEQTQTVAWMNAMCGSDRVKEILS